MLNFKRVQVMIKLTRINLVKKKFEIQNSFRIQIFADRTRYNSQKNARGSDYALFQKF